MTNYWHHLPKWEEDRVFTPEELWAPDFLAPFFRMGDTVKEVGDIIGDIKISIGKEWSEKTRIITVPIKQVLQLILVHQQAGKAGNHSIASLVDQTLVWKEPMHDYTEETDHMNFYIWDSETIWNAPWEYRATKIMEDPFEDIPDEYMLLFLHSLEKDGKLSKPMQEMYGSTKTAKTSFLWKYVDTFIGSGMLYISDDNINFSIEFRKSHGYYEMTYKCHNDTTIVSNVMSWLKEKAKEAENLMIQDLQWKVLDHRLKNFDISNDKPDEELLLDDESSHRLFHPFKDFLEGKIKKRSTVLAGKPWLWKTLAGIQMILDRPDGVTAIVIKASSIDRPYEIQRLFKIARMLKPCMLMIDDAEHLMKMDENWERTELARTMIDELDSFEDNEGIFLMLTTNYADTIDPALAQRPWRINDFIYFSPPNSEIRRKYILEWIVAQELSNISEKDINNFIKASKWCSLDIIRWALEEWKTFEQDEDKFYGTIERIWKDYIDKGVLSLVWQKVQHSMNSFKSSLKKNN